MAWPPDAGPGQGAPKVTVLTAVYNAERFLGEATASILGQSFSDFEFLIIDDGSTDGSPAVLDGLQDRRVRLLRNEANIGLTRSLNAGLRQARGEYIARMDADDVSLPGRLAAQAGYLDAHPDVALVGANTEGIDAGGKPLWRTSVDGDADLLAWRLLFHNCLGGHGLVMFRREAALGLGGYDEGCRCSQDYDLWSRLSRSYNLAVLPQVLLRWRSHPDGISSRLREEQEATAARLAGRRLSELTGEEFGPELTGALRLFWADKLDGRQSPLAVHRALSRVLAAFVSHRLKSRLSRESPEGKIGALIGRGFGTWARRISRRRHLPRRLCAWALAARWEAAA